MTEVYQLDLDDDLLSHLAVPESIRYLQGERVGIELIEDPFVEEVFVWVFKHLHEHGKAPTPSVLAEEFELELNDPLTAIGDLLERLRERYTQNNARGVMEGLKDVYVADPVGVPHYMVTKGRELLEVVGKKGEQIGTGEVDRAMHLYDERVLRGKGPSLGYKEVDDHFWGLAGVGVLAAPPKGYKSWGGCNQTVTNVMDGKYVIHYSLELPVEETDIRIRCLAANVPEWKYRRGAMTKDDRAAIVEASELLDSLGTYRVLKPQSGDRTVDAMIGHAQDAGADLVVIDQLQYVETTTGKQLGGCDTREYWQPLNRMRDLSDETPIMLIHQFNREARFADKMPEMTSLKASAACEEVASLILGMWANKDMRRSGVLELGTLASRHSDLESWEVGVELTKGCSFEVLGIMEHEDE